MCRIDCTPDIRELTLKHGIEYPSDVELVMMILGSGIKGIPVEKLSEQVVKILAKTNRESIVTNLLQIKGMGTGKALAVASAIELGRRRNNHKNALIKTPKDVIPFIQNYSMQNQEHFLCITLNGGHEILQIRVVSVGTINQTIVHPREIFSEALIQNAAAIIVAHNHPSGNCQPSDQDIKTTQTLLQCSDFLGINLLDHIIFSRTSYYSFIEHNMLVI